MFEKIIDLKRYLEFFLKEIVETLSRNYKKNSVSALDKKKYKKECLALREEGIFLVENYLSKDQCEDLISEIDALIDKGSTNVWSDEFCADKRLYFADTLSSNLKKIYDDEYFRGVLKSYTGIENPVGMLLAGRIDAIEGNIGSGGGWHRDSPVHHQTKAIIYLNDVNESNGPFQYIRKSNKKNNIIKAYLKGVFYPGKYRFSEQEISEYNKHLSGRVEDITGSAGTLLFSDTKGLHRGKPISSGRRYVLFCYYWDKKIPKHFEKLKQI